MSEMDFGDPAAAAAVAAGKRKQLKFTVNDRKVMHNERLKHRHMAGWSEIVTVLCYGNDKRTSVDVVSAPSYNERVVALLLGSV